MKKHGGRAAISESAAIRTLIECVPTALCVFRSQNGENRCAAVNQRYAEMIGMPEEQLIGEAIAGAMARVHPDDRARCEREISAVSAQRRSSGIYRIRHGREDRFFWYRIDGRMTAPANGSAYTFFNFTSVDDLMHTQQALSQSRQALDALVRHVPGGMFVYSAEEDEQFSYVSDNMLSMLGYTRAEFDAKFENRFSNLIYAEDRERALREIWAQIGTGAYDACTYRIEKKDGTLLWVHDEGHVVADAAGKRWFYVVIVDVTDSVADNDDIRSQNHEFRQMIDGIPVNIVAFSRENDRLRVAAVNGYLCKSTRRTPEELLALTPEALLEIVHPEDRELVAGFFRSLFSPQQPDNDELTYRTLIDPARGYQWYHCSAVRSAQADGSQLVYAVYTDATYQKVKEEDFNRIIQELLAANPNSLCTFRLNLSRNLCSDGHGASAYVRQLLDARTADELLAQIAAIITVPNEAERFRAEFSREKLLRRFRAGEERISITYHRLTDSGEAHWVTTYFHMLENPYTHDVEAIAYSVDSDRSRKQEEIVSAITSEEYDFIGLVEAQSRHVSYYYVTGREAASLDMLPLGYDAVIDAVSAQMYSEEECRQYRQAVALDTVLAELEKKPVYVYSASCRSNLGRRCRKQISFRYLEEDRRDVMFTIADITTTFEHEEAEAQRLREALQSAERANRLKSDFLGNVSHDMRTPLNAILGYDRLALAADDPAAVRDYLRKIGTAGSTLLSLINDTLDLQRIETGGVELHPTPTSCGDVIREVVTSVRPSMEEKHIEFVLDNSRAVMATINVDLIRLREIFINLLSNAVKFTPEGGRVELVVECAGLEKDCVHDRIIVRDNGVGMSEEFQQRMFEPFAQERIGETKNIGGSGLGLTIVRRLVTMMGGSMTVRSAPHRGTEFTVLLDFERLDDRPEPQHPEKSALPDIRGVRVLLCEDNEMNTEIARSILQMYGAEVTAAADGAEGCRLFEQSAADAFDLILMDLRMPNLDGYEAARRIRASAHPRGASIPILAMSADAYASDVERALAVGMNGHVSKPVDPARLVAEIARLTSAQKQAESQTTLH